MDKESVEAFAELGKEAIKEIGKPVYEDGIQPVLAPAGATLGLIPRAIKAALAPLEQWILTKEYNIEETKKLLEQKLKGVKPEEIVPPEPYVAVPAIQAISYSMDSEELREMYANLLAKSMQKEYRGDVHPSFVEIIKQLCPDEAKLLRYMKQMYTVRTQRLFPALTITAKKNKESSSHRTIEFCWSDLGVSAKCEQEEYIIKYFDNLERLGIVSRTDESSLTDKALYASLINHPHISDIRTQVLPQHAAAGSGFLDYQEGYISITEFGLAFCRTCISPFVPPVVVSHVPIPTPPSV